MYSRGEYGGLHRCQRSISLCFYFISWEGRVSQMLVSKTNSKQVTEKRKKCQDRVVQSIIDIRDEYIKWPTEKERNQSAKQIEQEFLLTNCIGLMDGTLLPLGITPSCSDAAYCNGRKFPYSLTLCVINDDKHKIRAYFSGFSGSTQDNQVWRNMLQNQKAGDFLVHSSTPCMILLSNQVTNSYI